MKLFNKNKPLLIIAIGVLVILGITGCKKLVEAPPPTEIVTGPSAYASDATAIAVINGMYVTMNNSGPGQPIQGTNGIGLLAGASADEFSLYSGVTSSDFLYQYFQNNLSVLPGMSQGGSEHWASLYNYIFRCNAAIAGITASDGLSAPVKQQLFGEAKFLRGFFYFYLVNLFGDVPLVLGTDPEKNLLLARSSKTKVYEQIVADLSDAEQKLSSFYPSPTLISSTTERIRPTSWAAKAMLARVYLYTGDFAKAESKASEVINNTNLFSPLPPLNSVFLKNSKEAIWQIQPVQIGFNTREAQTLILAPNGPSTQRPVFLSNQLLNSFESGDQRAVNNNWVQSITVSGNTYFYPFKYKKYLQDAAITTASGTNNMTEYFMMLRLGEQYLIRAEARGRLNNLSGAIDDLDKIRQRAGLPLISVTNPGITQLALIDKILHEKQVELFSEWGHRWLDLKRTGNIDAVMTVVTPLKSNGTTSWQPYQALYPIPYTELQLAPNLVQNVGY